MLFRVARLRPVVLHLAVCCLVPRLRLQMWQLNRSYLTLV